MPQLFSQKLSQLRKETGASQRSVAAELNISQALLSHYEKGIREPGLDFVVRVCDYYGVSADYLLGRSEDKNNVAPAEFFEGVYASVERKIRAFDEDMEQLALLLTRAGDQNSAEKLRGMIGSGLGFEAERD